MILRGKTNFSREKTFIVSEYSLTVFVVENDSFEIADIRFCQNALWGKEKACLLLGLETPHFSHLKLKSVGFYENFRESKLEKNMNLILSDC